MRRRTFAGMAFGVAFVVIGIAGFVRQSATVIAPAVAVTPRAVTSPISTGIEVRPASAATAQAPPGFAASLRGTQHDGRLRADTNGDLVIERGIRDLFDYYLTTLGEHDLESIRSQLLKRFETELPASAVLQATDILEAYFQYRKQSGELQQQYPALNESNAFSVVADYFTERDALRHNVFEQEVANAFFSDDKADEQKALQKLQMLTGDKISSNETPEAINNSNPYAQYRAAIKASPDPDVSSTDRDALRTQLFGREAADRLAALDQRRREWSARITSYQQQKQQILAAAAHAGIDPATQLQQLQKSLFNKREILRIRVLDESTR